jgi:hypothetical protein
MATSGPSWNSLAVGDQVRVVHFPTFLGTTHDETRLVYEQLVDRRVVLTVDRIDEDGHPWVEFFDEPTKEYHYLMINHDGLELVLNSSY